MERLRAQTTSHRKGPDDAYRAFPTEEAMDDWLAQRYRLDLNSIPRVRPVGPNGMPREAYEVLRKYVERNKETEMQTLMKKKEKKAKKDIVEEESKVYQHPTPMLYPKTMTNLRPFWDKPRKGSVEEKKPIKDVSKDVEAPLAGKPR
jgi:hypothetical protein